MTDLSELPGLPWPLSRIAYRSTDAPGRRRGAGRSAAPTAAPAPAAGQHGEDLTIQADGDQLILSGGRPEPLLAAVQAHLGADAVIIGCDRSIVGGVAGFFGRERFTLVAMSAAAAAAAAGAAATADPAPVVAASEPVAPAAQAATAGASPAAAPRSTAVPLPPFDRPIDAGTDVGRSAGAGADDAAWNGPSFAAALALALEELDQAVATAAPAPAAPTPVDQAPVDAVPIISTLVDASGSTTDMDHVVHAVPVDSTVAGVTSPSFEPDTATAGPVATADTPPAGRIESLADLVAPLLARATPPPRVESLADLVAPLLVRPLPAAGIEARTDRIAPAPVQLAPSPRAASLADLVAPLLVASAAVVESAAPAAPAAAAAPAALAALAAASGARSRASSVRPPAPPSARAVGAGEPAAERIELLTELHVPPPSALSTARSLEQLLLAAIDPQLPPSDPTDEVEPLVLPVFDLSPRPPSTVDAAPLARPLVAMSSVDATPPVVTAGTGSPAHPVAPAAAPTAPTPTAPTPVAASAPPARPPVPVGVAARADLSARISGVLSQVITELGDTPEPALLLGSAGAGIEPLGTPAERPAPRADVVSPPRALARPVARTRPDTCGAGAPAPTAVTRPSASDLLVADAPASADHELQRRIVELAGTVAPLPHHGVVAVVGDATDAVAAAERLAQDAGFAPGDVLVMSPTQVGRRPAWMSLSDLDDAARRRPRWAAGRRPVFVAVVLTPGATGMDWARASLDVLQPAQVRLAVPGWRHAEELSPRLESLAPVDTIDLLGPVEPMAGVGFLDLAVPVASIDGLPATPERWSQLLRAAARSGKASAPPAPGPGAEPTGPRRTTAGAGPAGGDALSDMPADPFVELHHSLVDQPSGVQPQDRLVEPHHPVDAPALADSIAAALRSQAADDPLRGVGAPARGDGPPEHLAPVLELLTRGAPRPRRAPPPVGAGNPDPDPVRRISRPDFPVIGATRAHDLTRRKAI